MVTFELLLSGNMTFLKGFLSSNFTLYKYSWSFQIMWKFLLLIVSTLNPLDKEDTSGFFLFQFTAERSEYKSPIPESFSLIFRFDHEL